jgi:hypothetical protein
METREIEEISRYNSAHNLVTLNTQVNVNFNFTLSGGRLYYVKHNQKASLSGFNVFPALNFKQIDILCDHDGDDIVKTVDDALGEARDKMNKLIQEGAGVDNDIQEEGEKPSKIEKNRVYKMLDGDYFLVSNINNNEYTGFTVYRPSKNAFVVKKGMIDPSEVRSDVTETMVKKVEASSNDVFNGNFNVFIKKAGIELDDIQDVPEQKVSVRRTKPDNIESDDIYKGREISLFKNINKFSETSEVSVIINNLILHKTIKFTGEDVVFNIDPKFIEETLISHTEAKKGKIIVNNVELRPKEEMGFLKVFLPSIKLKVVL